MPEITIAHIGLLALMLVAGVVVGWLIRADRCAKEKIAVNASWQDQLESQQSEHNRLAEQNKSLMEQISQYQASHKDYSNRAKELSGSLKEAFARRDELQRQLKDTRSQLELAVVQRNKAREELRKNPQGQTASLKEKDDKIFHLSRELTSWQSRVPPLVEKFQEKNREVGALQAELDKANTRLQALEDLVKSDQTRIEPVDAGSLPDGGDASNEPIAMTATNEAPEIQDQIDADEFASAIREQPADKPDTSDDDSEVVAMSEFSAPQRAAADDDDDFGTVFSAEEEPETLDEDDFEIEQMFAAGSVEHETPSAEHAVDKAPEPFGADEDVNAHDDLKMIKGIGPSIEKTLNDLGVYRFHQIAEMSEYDIDRVAQQLRGFRSRIYREDWIGQARDLQYQKNNDRS